MKEKLRFFNVLDEELIPDKIYKNGVLFRSLFFVLSMISYSADNIRVDHLSDYEHSQENNGSSL